jgi:hypothetical protein
MYFLGAGASFGAGAYATVQAGGRVPIPTQANFWVTFLRFCNSSKNRNVVEAFLFRYFLGYGKKPSRITPTKKADLLSRIDVEEVFTFLSERSRAPSTSTQLRTYVQKVWRALAEEIGRVFHRFTANKATRTLYRTLIKNHFRRSDAIVSFNYDTVFEDSLPKGKRRSYVGISHSPGIPIYKPHGSINWVRNGGGISVTDSPEHCVVVAPTHLKFISGHENGGETSGYLDQSLEISNVWSLMEREMRAAAALVFIGYSFPVADLYFASVLRSVLADRDDPAPAVVIVNPDAVAIAERVAKRFPLAKIVKYYDVHQFANASRKSLLSAT